MCWTVMKVQQKKFSVGTRSKPKICKISLLPAAPSGASPRGAFECPSVGEFFAYYVWCADASSKTRRRRVLADLVDKYTKRAPLPCRTRAPRSRAFGVFAEDSGDAGSAPGR